MLELVLKPCFFPRHLKFKPIWFEGQRGVSCAYLEDRPVREGPKGRQGSDSPQVSSDTFCWSFTTLEIFMEPVHPPSFLKKRADLIAAGDSCDGGCWLWGGGAFLPSSVTGFNGSANCGIRGLSSRFICSKPSLQTNGLDQVTLLPFPPVLCSSEKSMGQHKTGSAGIPCSGALKSPALSVVVPVSPGAEPAQNLSPAGQTPGQQKTLALPPSSRGLEPHSFFFFF